MNDCAPETSDLASRSAVSLELRYAQRAFAALIDERSQRGEFRIAQLRSAIRRTLSALSADDRGQLASWLSLQLATHARGGEDLVLAMLDRIDARLAARVRRVLPHVVEMLAPQSRVVAA